jgi:hypothetical protein
VPLVVESKVTGLAYGVLTAMQNLACAAVPLVVADIYSHSSNRYIPNVEFLFVWLSVVGVIVGVYLNYADSIHAGNVLNRGLNTAANNIDTTVDDASKQRQDLNVKYFQVETSSTAIDDENNIL